MTKKIKLGENIEIDLPTLIDTRLLITANSGGGKSFAIRKLLEETHGEVQQIILDIEGEFRTLREKFDYVLIGKGGDLPTNIKSAELLATKLLEMNVSAIIDLYELKQQERKHFVKLFLNSTINAPKELWHPVMVVVDEAHLFVPEKGESEASEAVIDLMTRGRKRGFMGVLATQRLSKLHKDAAAETNNKIIGRCSLDIDMKRGAEELGFTSKEQMKELRTLDPGEFFVFGTAISKEVKKGKVGQVRTTHPKAGSRQLTELKMPSSDKIKKVLKKLENLPQEVEKELKTKQDLQNEINRLKIELRQKPKEVKVEVDINAIEKVRERGFKEAESKYMAYVKPVEEQVTRLKSSINKLIKDAASLLESKAFSIVGDYKIKMSEVPKSKTAQSYRQNDMKKPAVIYPHSYEGESKPLREGAMKMLRAIGMFNRPITRNQVAVLSGFAASGGTFSTYITELKRIGWVVETSKGLEITDLGLNNAGQIDELPTDTNELITMWASKFREGAGKMLKVIADRYPDSITREELGEATGFTHTGGTFSTYITELKKAGLVEESAKELKATKELFLEE